MKQRYFVEMTDTYCGEANYSWVHRFIVTASSFRGAMRVVTRETGYYAHKVMDCGDFARYNVRGACVTFFVNSIPDGAEGVRTLESMYNVKVLN